jgi:Domain of unknown function (DUF4429)
VQWKPAGALVNGYIQFTIPGGNERRSRAGSATVDAGRDENSVVFSKKQMPAFERLRGAVQEAVTARANGHLNPPPPAGADTATRLQQLQAHLDQDLISRDEYDAKRAALLSELQRVALVGPSVLHLGPAGRECQSE